MPKTLFPHPPPRAAPVRSRLPFGGRRVIGDHRLPIRISAMRRLLALLLPLALVQPFAATAPAAAQGEDFYVQQYNSSARELGRHFSELRNLRERMSTERDFTAGCGLLSSVIYELEQMQGILKDMLRYLDQMGDVEGYNSSVTDYNNLVDDLNGSRDDYQRLCASG